MNVLSSNKVQYIYFVFFFAATKLDEVNTDFKQPAHEGDGYPQLLDSSLSEEPSSTPPIIHSHRLQNQEDLALIATDSGMGSFNGSGLQFTVNPYSDIGDCLNVMAPSSPAAKANHDQRPSSAARSVSMPAFATEQPEHIHIHEHTISESGPQTASAKLPSEMYAKVNKKQFVKVNSRTSPNFSAESFEVIPAMLKENGHSIAEQWAIYENLKPNVSISSLV